MNEISKAIAAAALSGLAPPFKPKQEPADYLRELLFNLLKTLHGRPTVATLVVLQLSSNPVLDPLLAERLLLALARTRSADRSAPKNVPAGDGRHSGNDLVRVLAIGLRRTEGSLSADARDDCFSIADGVSEFDGIARGNRRRDYSGGRIEAIPRGRRSIRGPARRNARRQIETRRLSQTNIGPLRGHALSAPVSK